MEPKRDLWGTTIVWPSDSPGAMSHVTEENKVVRDITCWRDSTEEEIRRETRRACEAYAPGGHFIPCLTYGGPGSIYPRCDQYIDDEIDKYNAEHFGI